MNLKTVRPTAGLPGIRFFNQGPIEKIQSRSVFSGKIKDRFKNENRIVIDSGRVFDRDPASD
jgi:hypothetical protein